MGFDGIMDFEEKLIFEIPRDFLCEKMWKMQLDVTYEELL